MESQYFSYLFTFQWVHEENESFREISMTD